MYIRRLVREKSIIKSGTQALNGVRVGNGSHCSFVSVNHKSVPVTHALATEAA